jgi:hypothetical protein
MIKQHGSAGRDQYNVAGDLHQYRLKVESEALRTGWRKDKDGGGELQHGVAAGGGGFIVIVIIVIIVIANSGSSLPNIPFPSRSRDWPIGATASAIMLPVLSRLHACSLAPVLAPVNCPQSEPDSYSDVATVHWSLHGDPADDAKIVYWKKQFYVAGNVAMEVTYSDAAGDNLIIQIVHYRARLLWRNGQATLTGIQGVDAASGPRIIKHEPKVTWSQVREALRSAFNNCVKATWVPLPPQCPIDPYSGATGNNAQWRLMVDPLLDAQESFDSASGLIHVTGSYAMDVTYSGSLLGQQHDSPSGNYDATIWVDGTSVDVLQIRTS